MIHPAWALTSSTSDVYTKRVAAEGFPSTLIFTPEVRFSVFVCVCWGYLSSPSCLCGMIFAVMMITG